MTESPIRQAGAAMVWKAIQLGGVQIVFLLRLLLLARLVSPEDFGLLAIAVSALGFVLAATDLGMIPALIQSEDIDDTRYDVAWTVAATRALLIGGAVFFAAPLIADIFAEPRAVPIMRVLALRPLLEALASIKVAGLTRQLHFRPLAVLKMAEALVNAVVSLALASLLGVWALVAGVLAGAAMCLILSYRLAPHRPRLLWERSVARSLIRFGRWIFLTSLIAMVGATVLRAVISRQLGVAELGLYYLAAQLAFLPAQVASEVVGAVAFPLYSQLQSSVRQAAQTFHSLFIGMATLLLPLCALLIALAPALVQDVLGPRWAGSAPLIRVLALVSLIGLFGEAAQPVIQGFGQPDRITLNVAVQYVLLVVFVLYLTERLGLIGAALAWLPANLLPQVLSAVFLHRILPRPLAGIGPPLSAVAFISALGALVALAVYRLAPGLGGLVLAGVLAALAASGVLWVLDRRFALGLAAQYRRVFPQFTQLWGAPR